MLGKSKLYLTTLVLFALSADHAVAGFLRYTPPPTPTPVPELDGPGALAALALLASVVAVLFNRSRAR
jgi:hypothetical protein